MFASNGTIITSRNQRGLSVFFLGSVSYLQSNGCHWENNGTTPSFAQYSLDDWPSGRLPASTSSELLTLCRNDGRGVNTSKSKVPIAQEKG